MERIYILGVHIADVTNYVQENSALDGEAIEAWNECISGRPGDPDASTRLVKWHLFSECRRRPAGTELYYGQSMPEGQM